MDGDENSHRFSSGIPRLNRANPNGRSLHDITVSANNSAAGTMMPPPGTISRKYGDSITTESAAPARKTLAERGGETRKQNHFGHSASKSMSSKPLYSASTSTSSRPASAASRNNPYNPNSSSNGPSSRTRSSARNIARPQTSFGYGRSHGGSSPRPITSMSTRDDDLHDSVLGKRKGMNAFSLTRSPFSLQSNAGPAARRGSYDNHMNYTSDWSSSFAAQSISYSPREPVRDVSLSTAMKGLTLNPHSSSVAPSPRDEVQEMSGPDIRVPKSPVRRPNCPVTPSPIIFRSLKKSPRKSPPKVKQFLTRGSSVEAWDQDAKMEKMHAMCDLFLNKFQGTTNQSAGLKEAIELYKSRLQEVEEKNSQLSEHNITLRVDLDTTKSRLLTIENGLKHAARDHEIEIDDLDRQHRIDLETSRQGARKQIEELVARHKEELRELRRRFDNEIENERSRLRQELTQMNAQTSMDIQRTQIEVENKDRELRNATAKVDSLTSDLDRERALNKELQHNLVQHTSNIMTLESSNSALKARTEFLESGNKEQSDAFGRLDQELRDALAETQATKDKLRKEETLRRKLHNQVQELKGNIRVFCRVRPLLDSEPVEDSARIEFPDSEADSKEIAVLGPEEKSSLGNITTKNYAYSFDHVFGPSSQNTDVFEEISQLVQSALDGYNVCIFCYGQTGSGKTHTMSSDDGMIPRAVHQIYNTASALEEKGWQYTMQGNFVEVYNENLNDLLGKAEEFDKKKHEIRHDMQKCKTTITDITTVHLDSPARVESILRRAAMNRSVAATKANERSSRSHSVFILKLIGENRLTGERSEGTLNLVDLAGSERLSHSKATGERLKETQSINRSLSCLGDVIGALGQGKEGGHIPYRNSKLTYLLQFSLGGNSKTLMFVMVSPRQEHLSETLTSLKFATKVHNTHIGTAKKQTKMIRES
ncbi:kinesin family member C1 [Blastomyces silverae]|uniref:Kinesin-like protein n=1 Tax=Blastomyces silverae TaxID=2060906 RepID=A0A0H1BBT4_9EURO|nr:kinesin family member C1 [Blastomyces silverae]